MKMNPAMKKRWKRKIPKIIVHDDSRYGLFYIKPPIKKYDKYSRRARRRDKRRRVVWKFAAAPTILNDDWIKRLRVVEA